jgi:formylmethanofuran dehydrogenase subunit B
MAMPSWIDGRPVTDADAIAAAGRRLGQARAPLVAGLSGDVALLRAAGELAARLGATIDAPGSGALYAELSVLASAGLMATTVAETRARADCVLVVGKGPERSPLLRDILEAPPRRGGSTERRVIRLDHRHLDEAVAVLRARLAGRMALAPDKAMDAVAEALLAARFAVIVHDPGELGELALDMLQGLIRDLNVGSRCSSLAVSGEILPRGALAVLTWTAAPGLRLGFGRGEAEHDPWRFDAERMVGAGECDLALWLAPLPAPPPPWQGSLPGVAVIGEAKGREADIVIEAAVPGQSATGVVWDETLGTFRVGEAAEESALPQGSVIVEALLAAALEARGAPRC